MNEVQMLREWYESERRKDNIPLYHDFKADRQSITYESMLALLEEAKRRTKNDGLSIEY